MLLILAVDSGRGSVAPAKRVPLNTLRGLYVGKVQLRAIPGPASEAPSRSLQPNRGRAAGGDQQAQGEVPQPAPLSPSRRFERSSRISTLVLTSPTALNSRE